MSPVVFYQRAYPSANTVVLLGSRPVMVDSGFGSDVDDLLAWLKTQHLAPEALSLLVNTHSHCDHAGGNHAMQHRHGLLIAAQVEEAEAVNRRDPDACRAQWLRQPVEPYQVNRMLRNGDRVGTGEVAWTVIATPGHMAGHISLHSADHGILVLGDAMHFNDIGWLNPYREGADSLEQAAMTIERLSRLQARIGYSGHGPAITDLPAAYDRARRRLQSWRDAPERVAWHACKRIFAHALMLTDGLAEAAIAPMLLDAPWFRAHATGVFGLSPEAFVPRLLTEMLRGDAACWRDGRLVATAAYRVPVPAWATAATAPAAWPPVLPAVSLALD